MVTGFAVLLAFAGAAVNLAVGLYLVDVNALAELVTQGTSLSVLITFSQIENFTPPVVGGVGIEEISWTAGFGLAAVLAIADLITILVAPSTA